MARLVITSFVIALLAIPAVGSSALGADTTCRGLEATIVGTARSDVIRGTEGRDVIVAGDGNDRVFGDDGFDVICGGPGRDRLIGGRGEDRIFGNRGKDILRGGGGFDRLDGGKALDACYPGTDGGDVVDCEEADLRVTIHAPSSRVEGAAVTATVRVRNVGSKPSGPFKLFIKELQRRVDCGIDRSLNASRRSLAPGEWLQWPAGHPKGCQITGPDHFIRIDARVRQTTPDARPSNDSDTARIDITR
jgi:Ca2+-binding RTX toxin-like protein